MTAMPRDPWPLSAAATEVLRNPTVPAEDVLKLALKELALRGVWRLGRPRPKARRGSRGMPRKVVAMTPTDRRPPPLVPLVQLHDSLPTTGDDDLHVRLWRAMAVEPELPDLLRVACREHLAERGLLERRSERRLVLFSRTRWARTEAGDCMLVEARERLATLTGAAEIGAAGGLLLLLDDEDRAQLATRLRQELGSDFGGGGDLRLRGLLALDLENVDATMLDLVTLGTIDLADFEVGVDAAVDSGGAGGDGGGAGGGDGGQ
jgi:hypothetical protein